ncbi:MAG: AraC family transcriptional regulator [Oscillospiraceae bacterium]|nr:AraC family transcriptional regulator [Oscillospiraceae bacterium]
MVKEYVYSPHYDFFIEKTRREAGYNMGTFHMHKKYELYYQLAGTRKYFIEDSAYFINAGDIVLIDKDEVHKTGSVDDNPHARIVLNFNEEYIAPIANSLTGVDLLAVMSANIKVLPTNMKQQALLEDILERLVQANEKNALSPQNEALSRLLLCELLLYLTEIITHQKTQVDESPKIKNKTIDEITHYIASNYKEKLSLADIAARFYLSPYYLSRLFKKTTNLSLVEYINSVRLHAAKDMLETTNIKISEVAEQTGYTTAAHFTRMFKAGTGMSPHDYRKIYQIKQDKK